MEILFIDIDQIILFQWTNQHSEQLTFCFLEYFGYLTLAASANRMLKGHEIAGKGENCVPVIHLSKSQDESYSSVEIFKIENVSCPESWFVY